MQNELHYADLATIRQPSRSKNDVEDAKPVQPEEPVSLCVCLCFSFTLTKLYRWGDAICDVHDIYVYMHVKFYTHTHTHIC